MIDVYLLIQLGLSTALAWALWGVSKSVFYKNPLDNIPGPRPQTFWLGNWGQLFSHKAWSFHRHLVDQYGAVAKVYGSFGSRQLYVADAKALQYIIVKEQHIWEETDWFIQSNRLTFGMGLLSTLGNHHKRQRKMLNPVFTPATLREMVPIFYEVTHKMRDAIAKGITSEATEVDMLHWTTRAALELIGQGGLGYSFDDFQSEKPTNDFAVAVKNFIPCLIRLALYRPYLPLLVKLGPARFRRFITGLLPFESVQIIRKVVDTMYNKSIDIFERKKRALAEGQEVIVGGRQRDIMSILLKANSETNQEDRLTDEELIGQMSTLIFAAMDTTSSALARILSFLIDHPDVQEKLRAEINEARSRNGGDLEYDELSALVYLDAVCRETLRLASPVSQIFRVARESTILPLSTPIIGVDGNQISEIPIPKGTQAFVGIIGANRNPEVWGSDAYEWKPERWLNPLPETVTQAHYPGVYANLMTFSGGGRACIGFKFSQLEMKVVLSVLLQSFKFTRSDKEIVWNFANVAFPVAKGENPHRPQLPVKVEKI